MNAHQPRTAHRLRVLTAEAHRIEGRPAYEYIIHSAFERGLAGASAFRGFAGFGRSHRLHTTKILDISEDLPVIIELIDEKDRLESFAEWLRSKYTKGLFTMDEVQLLP